MVDLTPQDRDMMIRTVIGEAADQPVEGQAGVASVIFNRLNSGNYGDSPTSVVLAPNQFKPWQTRARELLSINPTSDQYNKVGAVVDAVASGKIPDPTNGADHFLQPETVMSRYGRLPGWARGPGQRIGAHVFYGGKQVAQNQPDAVTDADVADTARTLGFTMPGAGAAPAASVSSVASPQPAATGTAGDGVSADDVAATAKELGISLVPEKPPQVVTAPSGRPRVYIGTRAPTGRMVPPALPSQQFTEGMPVVGPAVNYATAAAEAGVDPLINFARSLMGKPPNPPLSISDIVQGNRASSQQFQQEHPAYSTAAQLAGGGMMLGPVARTSLGGRLLGTVGENLPWRMLTGAGGGAGVGSLDAYLRGENPVTGAELGAGAGVAGPLLGEAARGGAGWLVNNVLPRTGPLARYMPSTVTRLINAMEGETPQSMQGNLERMGPEGFMGDVNTGMTDLAGGAADVPGPQKQAVRQAYADRAAGQRQRISDALDQAFGTPATDVNAFEKWLTETRAAAADPLYEQWRSMAVHPTDKLKGLIPRLDAAGAFNMAEELSGISGRPINRKFFTPGNDKDFPTTEAWDYVKRGLDRGIDKAYAGGDKTLARELIGLKKELISEIGKTNAGKIWSQAREAFAERSSIIDQLAAGKDDFLGGRSGITADELREELSTLKGPELAARVVGARTAIDDAMGATLNGDGTMRAKLLAPNSQKKLRLLLGDQRANDLIKTLEQEQYLMGQTSNVVGNIQTGASAPMRSARRDALLPNPMQPWDFDLAKPMSWLPPAAREALSLHGLVNARRGATSARALNELGPLLTLPQKAPQFSDLLNAIHAEQIRRATSPLANLGTAVNNRLAGLLAVPAAQRQVSP